MPISKEEVKYTANLARIELAEKELDLLARHLEDIVNFVDKLKEVDIKEVAPTSHVLPISNVFRNDQVLKSLSPDEVFKSAPAKEKNFFKVPKVIE